MHRFFVENNQVKGTTAIYLEDPADIKHLVRVLRADVGEKIEICSADGTEYVCEIEEIFKDQVVCGILEKKQIDRESPVELHLFQGLPKADKMDLIVQKNVELGVNVIVPIAMARSVSKIADAKDGLKKTERWQKIADEAAKQSKRSAKVSVQPVKSFKAILKDIETFDLFLVPYELESGQGLKTALVQFKEQLAQKVESTQKIKIAILIGPEGGISDKELQLLLDHKALPVSLGPRILRTETAGFAAVTAIQYELGDLG